MSKFLLLIITSSLTFYTFQTNAQDFYWVAFSNKSNSEYSLSKPEMYLSERAIQRRIRQNIAIDSLDLPVDADYISEVVVLGAEFVHASKWLNGITVKVETDSFINRVLQLSFVKEAQLTKPRVSSKSIVNKFRESGMVTNYTLIDTSVYGSSVYQTGILNGQYLHNQNYKGQGMQIAILDAGFLNADTYLAFDSLWENNQILGVKDFVEPNSQFFSQHYHGMSVLSCMGGNVSGSLIGTAPKASYWLIRSEDANSEYLIEEDNWVAAAEFADSAGVDIINSSLGYYQFNDSSMNHTYSDMDGGTTRVTRGANIAATRGIAVFASAGNEGNDSWKYIVAPSDGEKVIAVGAIDRDSIPAVFTSIGPAFGGKIKPNVTAIGWNTWLQRSDGTLGYSNGTSFSSPVMAGMAACLWQAFPYASAAELKNALEWSAHKHENPDSLLGFGIPDMGKASFLLMNLSSPDQKVVSGWTAYPNPIHETLILQKSGSRFDGEITIEIYSSDGKLLRKWLKNNAQRIELNDINSLPNGILLLKISSAQTSETIKLSKAK